MADRLLVHDGNAKAKTPRVVADPHAELPIKNYKYVKNCTELFLAQRGIDELAHFEGFVNLEVLWLNGNRIETLDALDQCFRIKELHAQGNRIRSLAGSSLVCFAFLETLRLNNNKLRDLQTTLSVLGKLHHLRDLDLYGNPLEEEDNYRLHVIRAVPSLVVLDRHVVTDEERAAAMKLRDQPASKGPKKPRKKKVETVAGAPPQTMSGTVKMLFKEVEKITREAEAARKAALEKELKRIDQQQQQLTTQTSGASKPRSSLNAQQIGGLDAWELAALEKTFHALGDKPKSGLVCDKFGLIVEYLADRGFRVRRCSGDEEVSVEELAATAFGDGDSTSRVMWPQVRQALESDRLRCELMTPAALKKRADSFFAQAETMQRRLLLEEKSGTSSSSDEKQRAALFQQEVHGVSQRAYHLAALAEREQLRSGGGGGRWSPGDPKQRDGGVDGSPPPPQLHSKTKYYVTAYGRDATATKTFDELKEQCSHVESELLATYKLQRKDFQKYLVKRAPPAQTLARRQYHL